VPILQPGAGDTHKPWEYVTRQRLDYPGAAQRSLIPGQQGAALRVTALEADNRAFILPSAMPRMHTLNRTVAVLWSASVVPLLGVPYFVAGGTTLKPWNIQVENNAGDAYVKFQLWNDVPESIETWTPNITLGVTYLAMMSINNDAEQYTIYLIGGEMGVWSSTHTFDEGGHSAPLHSDQPDVRVGANGMWSSLIGDIDGYWQWPWTMREPEVRRLACVPWRMNRYPRPLDRTGYGTNQHYGLYRGEGGPDNVDFDTVVGLANPGDATIELLDGVSQPEGQHTFAVRACSVGWLESTPVYDTIDIDGEGCYTHLTAPEIQSVTAKPAGMVEVKMRIAEPSTLNGYQILAGQTVADLAIQDTLDGGTYFYTATIGPLADGRWQIRTRTKQGARLGPLSPPRGVRVNGTAPADPGTIIEIEQGTG